MGFRKIHIDDRVFDYYIGQSHILIKEDGVKMGAPSLPEVTGWDWNEIERGRWKHTFRITPSQISKYITQNYLNQ